MAHHVSHSHAQMFHFFPLWLNDVGAVNVYIHSIANRERQCGTGAAAASPCRRLRL
eukprot:NODE_3853_length_516_cov_47.653105_g3283_i0.p3 GENE.NODE_3853_length_516_cov_47.653105_g3283_i0~~NODE_3853_length_516_cov_47.653105_g3283_i0.p3  ORF type:complete len:56 (+),score=1.06 NODE_3853_length_516_cov_47.653105_g3283_i0:334-501(+)